MQKFKNNQMEDLKLGDHVTCNITGYYGVITAVCNYLHGETQFQVTSGFLINNEIKTEWFERGRLERNQETV